MNYQSDLILMYSQQRIVKGFTLCYKPEIQVWTDLWPREAYTNSSEYQKHKWK